MLHQILLQTAKPGKINPLLEHFIQKTIPIRQQHGDQLVGAWVSEFGELNLLISLWSYADFVSYSNQMQQLNLSQVWLEHTHETEPMLEKSIHHLLIPQRPITLSHDAGQLFDFRIYETKPFLAPTYAKQLLEVLPVREKHSNNYAIWIPATGNTNRIFHMWPYADLNQRMNIRNQVAVESEWQLYLKNIFPMLVRQSSTLVRPIAISQSVNA